MSTRTNRIITALILVFVLVTTAPAFAESTIYVDADATGANDGSSWTDAFNFLQDALAIAYYGDEIRIAQGTYKPDQGAGITLGDREATFQLINGVTIKGGYAGAGTPDPNARDIDSYETILSGDIGIPDDNLDNSYHVLTGSGTDETALLDGFIITSGNANGSYPHDRGGAMYIYRSSPTLANCMFSKNSAKYGGGMYNHSNSSPTVSNCTFSGNSAERSGGGMYNSLDSPTVTDCTFIGNSAGKGGGMYNSNCSPTVSNCTFSGNSVDGGTSYSYGGGMHNDEYCSPTVSNCTFSGNSADGTYGRGGGMSNADGSHPMLVNCTFTGNSAKGTYGGFGGGMHSDLDCKLTVTNCTFNGNSADVHGGGIHSDRNSNPTVTNCIFWCNIDSGGSDELAQIYGDPPVINYCCVQGWTGVLGGACNIGDDPLFTDSNNVDYHLLPGSPCIDAGDPNFIAEPNETDLDGNPRVINGRIDMGAYEFQGPRNFYVDDDAVGANDGSSWSDAFNFLQDALAVAYSGDEIWVAQGIYTPDSNSADPNGSGDREATFHLINGVTLKGGFAGIDEPDPKVRDIELYETILTGDLYGDDAPDFANNGENSYHVLMGGGTDRTAVLDGFTITGGNANGVGGTYPKNCGGGMFNTADARPTLSNCTFTGNSGKHGSGMYNCDSSPRLTNCKVIGNSATWGGGIANRNNSSPILTNCTFSGNSAYWGGGMFDSDNCSPVLTDCVFNRNSAYKGGGISNYGSTPILTNCTFSGNLANKGGGISNYDGSIMLLVNCILWGDSYPEIYGSAVLTYSNVRGGWPGEGNIDANPLFRDPRGIDGILGTEDDNLRLAVSSPCIDAGDPNYILEPNETDLDGNPRIIGGRIDMGAYEAPIFVEAKIVPKTINLASKGNWITCYIWLPEQYNVADIEPNSILLKDEIKPTEFSVDEQAQLVTAKFTREDVQPILEIGDIELKITGLLIDGAWFEATDAIKVTDKASQKAGE